MSDCAELLRKTVHFLNTRIADIPQKRWEEDEVLISKQTLTALKDGQVDVQRIILPLLVEFVRKNDERWGFVYPPHKLKVADVLLQIAQSEQVQNSSSVHEYSSLTRIGVNTLRSHFCSYWQADNGPALAIKNEKVITDIIKYRIGLNAQNELFDFTPEVLRRGFISSRRVVSLFKPTTAAAIYKTHLGDIKNPVVWDPSAGFGSRLLGFASVYPNGTYLGNEPAIQTYNDLIAFSKLLPNSTTIIPVGSEVERPSQPVDLVFTSPPYFDKEMYFDEPGQCWRDYPTESEWVLNYLRPTIANAATVLKIGGKLIINVDEKRKTAVMAQALNAGLDFVEESKLLLAVDHFAKSKSKKAPSQAPFEPMLIFLKSSDSMTVSIKGTAGKYTVSSEGDIYSYAKSAKGRQISGHALASGYMAVGIYDDNGVSHTKLIHRIVCSAFHGDPPTPEHTDVRHLDGNKKNNCASNLAWGTRSENMLDVVKHRAQNNNPTESTTNEIHPTRSWYGGRVLDHRLANTLAEMYTEGILRITDIARIMDCTVDVASNLIHGKTAKTIIDNPAPTHNKRSPAHVAEIIRLIKEGHNRETINETLNENLTHQLYYYYKTKTGKGINS